MMKFAGMNLLISVVIGLLSIMPFNDMDKADQSRWAVVGYDEVKFNQDKGVIPIKLKDKAFASVRLTFQGKSIDMHHISIQFDNGESQTVPLKKKFKDGDVSKIIDLHGGLRVIKKVEYYYTPDLLAKKKAFVELIGKMETKKEMAEN